MMTQTIIAIKAFGADAFLVAVSVKGAAAIELNVRFGEVAAR
jgi:hypothetical protein